MRRLVVVLIVVLGAAGIAPSSAEAATSPAGADERELLALINADRAAAGLAGLAEDPAAAGVARAWSARMAERDTLGHNPNLAADVDAHVTRAWTRIGENVGRGPSADRIEAAFMASTSHRDNVLGRFDRAGVGAVRDEAGRLWITVVFLLVPTEPVPAPAAATTTEPAWAPFDAPEAFAEQQYLDFLGRAGDAGGVAHWAGELGSGRSTGAGVVDSFLTSPEFAGVLAPVARLYFGAFARIPDQPGLQSWLDTRRRGASLATIADAFASSSEFRQRYPMTDERAFVDALHRSVFGRPADGAALAHWGDGLAAGRFTRGAVLLGVTASDEFLWTSWSEVSVTMAYVGLLRRSPDADGFAHWVGRLDAGRPVAELLAAHLTSDEYRARFG